MALILAGVVFLLTMLGVLCVGYANGMNPAPGVNDISAWPVFIGGTLISLALAGSHWLPHIGW